MHLLHVVFQVLAYCGFEILVEDVELIACQACAIIYPAARFVSVFFNTYFIRNGPPNLFIQDAPLVVASCSVNKAPSVMLAFCE